MDCFSVQDARKLSSVYSTASETTKRKLASMVFNKIRFFATMGHACTVWRVPPLLPDSPLYDREAMTTALRQVLTDAGYTVLELGDFRLFVSWLKV